VLVELVLEFVLLVLPALVLPLQLPFDEVLHVPQLPLAHDFGRDEVLLQLGDAGLLVAPEGLELAALLQLALALLGQLELDLAVPGDVGTHVLLDDHDLLHE